MTALERRFRQILRLYPAAYRVTYEEEMVGVLLATARPGQQRPHLRDTLDLVRHALAVRMRGLPSDDRWRDAAAIVSIVAPIFLCLGAAARAPIGITEFAVWPLCGALAMLGWRRSAAAVAWLGAALLGYVVILGVGVLVPWLVLAILAAGALISSGGATRGLALLGKARVVTIASGVAFLGLAELNAFNYGMRYFGTGTFEGGWALIQMRSFAAIGVVLVAAGLFWLSGPGHRRAALLLVVPLSGLALDAPTGLHFAGDVLLPFAAFVVIFVHMLVIERGEPTPAARVETSHRFSSGGNQDRSD